MGEFDASPSLWKQSEIIDDWGYAQELDRRELADIQKIAGRAAIGTAMEERSIPDIDISPEILNKLLLLVSGGYLKLNKGRITNQSIYDYVEALSGNNTVYALYVDEEDKGQTLISICDLSTEDVPLIDDSNGIDYKLLGVYASREEAESEV